MGSDRPPLPCKEDHQPLSLAGWDGEAAFHVVEGCPRHDFTPFDLHGKLVGLPCHRTCYMLLITHFKYKLKLRDVQSLQTGRVRRARLMGGEYGGMLDYQYEVNWLDLLHSLQLPLPALGFSLTTCGLCSTFCTQRWERMATSG